MLPSKLIAEIGCNHMGSLDIAKEMIVVAATFCKVEYVKFQKRTPRELLSREQYDAPHPNPMHSFGETYGAHREFLEFNIEQHHQLKEYCAQFGVQYTTSVWDLTSTKEVTALAPSLIKVPSACNLRFDLLDFLCAEFGGEIHVSTGMTTPAQIESIVERIASRGRAKDIVLYACTSGYPVAFPDICLLEIGRLQSAYGSTVKGIGFSGHHLGIAVDVAAMTLGAGWIERHFTLDRTQKGTDHAASLEPDGLRRLSRDLKNVSRAIARKESDILEVEKPQLQKLKLAPSA